MGDRVRLVAPRADFGLGQGVVGPVEIIVENGQIDEVYVGPVRKGDPTRENTQTFSDTTILPGLINAHTHLGLDAGDDPLRTVVASSLVDQYQGMIKSARACLDRGVTTVRDCGAPDFLDIKLRDAIARGSEPGPTMLVAGSVITCREGHLAFMGLEADTTAEVRAAVRHVHGRGANFVKVVLSGGRIEQTTRYTRFQSQYSTDVLRALVEEAHEVGLRVAAHAHAVNAISVAVEAGVDSIEHCLWLDPDGQRFLPDLAQRIAHAGIWVVPTLSRSFPRPERSLPNDALIPDWVEHLRLLETMAAVGVKMAAGGDNGAAFNPQSEFPREIELMARVLGAHTLAIRAATSWAAACIGVDHQGGSLEAGKQADFVVIPGNSDDDLSGLWSPMAVFKQGRRLQQSASR